MPSSDNVSHAEHGPKPFVFMEHDFPKEGKLDDVLKIAQDTSRILHKMPGLLMVQVLRPTAKTGPVTTMTIWESKDDFQALMKSPEFAKLLKSEAIANVQQWTSDIQHFQFDVVDGWHG